MAAELSDLQSHFQVLGLSTRVSTWRLWLALQVLDAAIED